MGDKRIHAFPKSISLKMNEMAQLEFELASYDIPVHYPRLSHTNGPRDRGSIPGRIIPKTQKMVLDATLFNTQLYKVRIRGKVEQSRERSSALPYTLVE